MSDASVHARSEREDDEGTGGEGGGLVVGQGVGNDHTTPKSRRKGGEGKDVAMCDVGRQWGRSGTVDEKEEEEERGGHRAAAVEGRRKRGGSDGVNCRRQGHRLYLAETADTCLRRYTRTVL